MSEKNRLPDDELKDVAGGLDEPLDHGPAPTSRTPGPGQPLDLQASGDDVAAGAANPGYDVSGPGTDRDSSPTIKVRIMDADLSSDDQASG